MRQVVFAVTNDISYDQRMMRICGTLAAHGYEVEIIGRRLHRSIALPDKPYKQTRITCIFNKGKLFYAEFNARLFLRLLFHRASIISAVDLDTIFSCTLAALIRSRKLVFDAHEHFTEVPEVVDRPVTKWIWKMIGRACIPHVQAAYTVGERLAEVLGTAFRKPFVAIRNVPLKSVAGPLEKSTTPVILYQGSLNEGRGLPEAIRAMHHVHGELWLAGEGDLSNMLRDLVRTEKLEQRVRFPGFVPPSELPALTARATIGLNLLEQRGLSYYYSLANKFFDYIQAGIPQVCAPFPEYEVINAQFDVAVLCPCETGTIADTINRLLHDAALYKRLQANCRNTAEILCWEHESAKIIALYDSL